MLRITLSTCEEKVVLKLEGRLAGPWVDELKKTVLLRDACRHPLEIDVSDLTFAEEDGEEILSWLHKIGARFRGKGPFSQYLCDRLKIPLVAQETVADAQITIAESRTPGTQPKRTGAKPQR